MNVGLSDVDAYAMWFVAPKTDLPSDNCISWIMIIYQTYSFLWFFKILSEHDADSIQVQDKNLAHMR